MGFPLRGLLGLVVGQREGVLIQGGAVVGVHVIGLELEEVLQRRTGLLAPAREGGLVRS